MGKKSKHEKKLKRKHKHKDHKIKKKHKKTSSRDKNPENKDLVAEGVELSTEDDFAIPVELMNSKSHVPETPEEYQKKQNHIRHVKDPVTGRTRLIKGDGEVLEEIVSRERHVEINKSSTLGDGRFFQQNAYAVAKK